MSKISVSNYFLSMFTLRQCDALRRCLAHGTPVHFYGTGLGKSTLVEKLQSAEFDATEAAELEDACAMSVPNKTGAICFCMKENGPKQMLLREELPSPIEIKAWIYSDTD